MGIAQMSALGGGRGFKRPYVEEINRTKYLPALYGQKKEGEHRDRMYGLGQRGLAQQKEIGMGQLDIQKDLAHEARKKNRLAQNLGYGNLALGGALGGYDAMGQPSFADVQDWFSPGGFDEAAGMFTADSGFADFFGGDSGGDLFGAGGGMWDEAIGGLIGF